MGKDWGLGKEWGGVVFVNKHTARILGFKHFNKHTARCLGFWHFDKDTARCLEAARLGAPEQPRLGALSSRRERFRHHSLGHTQVRHQCAPD